MKAFIDAANQSQRTDPVPGRAGHRGLSVGAVGTRPCPTALRYDPTTNPTGARPTVFDAARNIYGVESRDRRRAAAVRQRRRAVRPRTRSTPAPSRRRSSSISTRRSAASTRTPTTRRRARVGDAGAIKRAYQAGLMLGANGGLTSIPIFDNATSNETGGYHYGWFHFALRERLRQANGGDADNMVMWRSMSAHDRRSSCSTGGWSRTRPTPRAIRSGPRCCAQSRTTPSTAATTSDAAAVRRRRPAVHAASRRRSAASSIRSTRTRARKPAVRWPPTS